MDREQLLDVCMAALYRTYQQRKGEAKPVLGYDDSALRQMRIGKADLAWYRSIRPRKPDQEDPGCTARN